MIRRIPEDTFGRRVMLARSDAGNLTIDQAAKRCGLGAQNWSNWEHGRTPRDILDVAEAISEGLGVDRDWLLHGGPLTAPTKPRRIRSTYRQFSRPGGLRRPRRVDRTRIPA